MSVVVSFLFSCMSHQNDEKDIQRTTSTSSRITSYMDQILSDRYQDEISGESVKRKEFKLYKLDQQDGDDDRVLTTEGDLPYNENQGKQTAHEPHDDQSTIFNHLDEETRAQTNRTDYMKPDLTRKSSIITRSLPQFEPERKSRFALESERKKKAELVQQKKKEAVSLKEAKTPRKGSHGQGKRVERKVTKSTGYRY